MPELPEVETTVRGIIPHLVNRFITDIVIRQDKLRWPVSAEINSKVQQQAIHSISRRGKYLMLNLEQGSIMIHLGMSGRLRVLPQSTPAQRHDHIDILLSNQLMLRYTDPRRFGAMLWVDGDPQQHRLLKHLGIEPLDALFTGEYLRERIQHRSTAIKPLLMEHTLVVGIGNIYAAESLFLARIHPAAPGNSLSIESCDRLVQIIKQVLNLAIKRGGTTLKDFLNVEGKPGYFSQELHVYGRAGSPCSACDNPIQSCIMRQRNTFYCSNCQKFT